jgi:hypothetical protein
MPLPSWLELYRQYFQEAVDEYFPAGPFDLYDLAAICDRESAGGLTLTPKGPAGTGDGGHGRGLMQIDDRAYPDFCASDRWKDPRENIRYGAGILALKWKALQSKREAIAAYNCGVGNVRRAIREGQDIDRYTTFRNYSADVLKRAATFRGGDNAISSP